MEKIEFLKLSGPNLLIQHGNLVEEALREAVNEALLKHKQARNPIAVSVDGKVVILQPDEIIVENDPN